MQIPVRNNKVAIFDRHILLIGSYNWITAAEQSNDEDAIFVRTSVIAAYESAFENFGTTTSCVHDAFQVRISPMAADTRRNSFSSMVRRIRRQPAR